MGMHWVGYRGAPWGAWGWVFPLIGLLFMAVMVFVCTRMRGGLAGCGCMGSHRHPRADDTEALRRELRDLTEGIEKVRAMRRHS
jgi:hypothetical protein